ncbi:uncharacterized protein CTRU02_202557 [Colletotrichum truncatum]|uniref:Uncharacterized protein n=1 Tax=Colletotrichum truncatum TaxID=5467 RepID=A0ACC3ZKS8_COLTU
MHAFRLLILASLTTASVIVRDNTQSNNPAPKQGKANVGVNPDYTYVVFKRDAEADNANDEPDVEY